MFFVYFLCRLACKHFTASTITRWRQAGLTFSLDIQYVDAARFSENKRFRSPRINQQDVPVPELLSVQAWGLASTHILGPPARREPWCSTVQSTACSPASEQHGHSLLPQGLFYMTVLENKVWCFKLLTYLYFRIGRRVFQVRLVLPRVVLTPSAGTVQNNLKHKHSTSRKYSAWSSGTCTSSGVSPGLWRRRKQRRGWGR